MSNESKVMTAKEATSRFVHDGDSLVMGNYTEGIPYNLIFEIIRQKKRGLTYCSQSGSADADFLVAGDCVEKMCCAFIHKWASRHCVSLFKKEDGS